MELQTVASLKIENNEQREQYAGPPYGQNPSYPTPSYPGGSPYYPPQHHPHGNQIAPYPFPPSPPQPQQQQQQQVVVVNNSAAPTVFVPTVSMTCAITLACLTFWFCGWLFGGIAFILAIVGQSSASEGDTSGAIRLRNASYGLSITGIIIGVIIIIVVPIAVVLTATKAVSSSGGGWGGGSTCYNYNYRYYYKC